jgi:hypothetical protein
MKNGQRGLTGRRIKMRMFLSLIAMFFMFSCTDYKRMSRKCRDRCGDVQENNVGARFMWRDIDFTFGKCTCVSRNGKIKQFYMSGGD